MFALLVPYVHVLYMNVAHTSLWAENTGNDPLYSLFFFLLSPSHTEPPTILPYVFFGSYVIFWARNFYIICNCFFILFLLRIKNDLTETRIGSSRFFLHSPGWGSYGLIQFPEQNFVWSGGTPTKYFNSASSQHNFVTLMDVNGEIFEKR